MASRILSAIPGFITGVISGMGYPGIVALMAIESACIPLPSEVIMPFSGFLAAQGRFNLWLVGLMGALGCVAGSVVAYWVGFWGGRPVVQRYRRCLLISARDLQRADDWFTRYGGATVFFSRLMPVVRTFISLPAGVARMPFGRFCLYTFLGSYPWCLCLAYLGERAGTHWKELRRYFEGLDVVFLLVIVAGVAWWVWRHVKHEREARAQ
jgi:membrane protein DedA with SNARE-associated domain